MSEQAVKATDTQEPVWCNNNILFDYIIFAKAFDHVVFYVMCGVILGLCLGIFTDITCMQHNTTQQGGVK